MKHIKTFESFNPNTETVNEEFLDSTKKKAKLFIEEYDKNPASVDEKSIDKFLNWAFVITYSNSKTAAIKKLVDRLPLDDKVNLLKDALERLEYSKIGDIRLLKSKTSNKLRVGSIVRKIKEEPVQY